MNAVEIEEAISELAMQPFDAKEFPFAFLKAFDQKDTTIKRLRSGATNKSDIGGVLQTNKIHLKVSEAGAVEATLTQLRQSQATSKGKVDYILATDGHSFEAENLVNGEVVACEYSKFPDQFSFFLSLAGISTVKEIRENAFDIKATGRLNKLYTELLKDNQDWATAERRSDMNHFMARLIFCFFSEDTDIFSKPDMFTDTVRTMSESDSSNTHEIIQELFRAMNTNFDEREKTGVARWANSFPYVNGGLFAGGLEVPKFSKIARSFLLHIGELDWQKINPDIFGSMIQAVADDEERGELGMHYTSVPNILKVLNPLFLDDLREQLKEAEDNGRKLLNLRNRLAKIRVFDPACGSGNFLVIAYKEMREIEAEINQRRNEKENRTVIPITNFRGIELRDFSAEIARLALIIAEYQCDVLYRGQKEAIQDFLPLRNENWITSGNALRIDWLSVCPPTGETVKHRADDLFFEPKKEHQIDFENEGGETYICGNPPYLGAKKKSLEQVQDMENAGLAKAQLLDYVCAFIIKGVEVIQNTECGMALVSTSSICQGEQVNLLWPRVLAKASMNFAYRPFKWSNSAQNNAGVWCTIIGLATSNLRRKRLFYHDSVKECENIAPYLISGPSVICRPCTEPISSLAKMIMGSNPVDGKRLILESDQRRKIILNNPSANKFIKPYGGTLELINGGERWCLWVEDSQVKEALKVGELAEIVNNCAEYRKNAGRDAKKSASRPHAFCYSTYRHEVGIQVGLTIGNGHSYVPAKLRPAGFVSSHTAYMLYGWNPVEFAIIVSAMMYSWTETIGGKLGNGMRFSNTIAYNSFPVPPLTEKNKEDLSCCAENILLARESNFPASIADMYKLDSMPQNLREAHEKNDEVLERIYIGRRFKNDTERLEKLFELYVKMTEAPQKLEFNS